MYQPLIWFVELSNDARGLGAPLNAKDAECLTDALVHGVWRDVEFGRDFLGRKMLVDKTQAVQLTGRQPSYA